jgi:excisionase family DNA binding protein
MALTTAQAATLLGIDKRSVSRLANLGVLRARKQGRDWQIEQSEVERYRRERRPPGWRRRATEAPASTFAVRPEQPTTTQVATITTDRDTVMVQLPGPNETLNAVFKRLGYRWEGAQGWTKRLGATTGPAEDRIAEVGHQLLLAGAAVVFPSEALANRATTGAYTPEHHRWIERASDTEVRVRWPRHEDWYERAKQIYGSTYQKPFVVLPATSYDEILDFAERHDFHITDRARAVLAAARARYEAMLVVRPMPVTTDAHTVTTTDEPVHHTIHPEFLDDLDDDDDIAPLADSSG